MFKKTALYTSIRIYRNTQKNVNDKRISQSILVYKLNRIYEISVR